MYHGRTAALPAFNSGAGLPAIGAAALLAVADPGAVPVADPCLSVAPDPVPVGAAAMLAVADPGAVPVADPCLSVVPDPVPVGPDSMPVTGGGVVPPGRVAAAVSAPRWITGLR